MRKFLATSVVILTMVAVVSADEITGVVTKFEDGKITFTDFKGLFLKKGEGGKAEETTLPLTANAKILKGKFNLEGGFQGGALQIDPDGDYPGGKDALAKAVKDAAAKKAEAKKDDKKADDKKGGKKGGFGGFGGGGLFGGGVFAQIITEGEGDKAKVTEIRVIDIGNLKKKGGN